jgi:hypothetical protein
MNSIQVRRGLRTVALLSVLGLAVTGLSQCRMVDDNVTGVDLHAMGSVNDRSDCVQRCNDVFKENERRDDAKHSAEVRACGGDQACKKDADARDKNRHAANVDAMQECKRSCYNEGSGSGGR